MSSTLPPATQDTPQDIVPARPWATVFNKRLGHWVTHHQQRCERGETSTLFTIHTSLNDEKDAAVAAFVVKAVNAYNPAPVEDLRDPCESPACAWCNPAMAVQLIADLNKRVEQLEDVLNLFREFVGRNATQWQLGAGSHHHPMWALLAETLGDKAHDVVSGPDYKFIGPRNQLTRETIIT